MELKHIFYDYEGNFIPLKSSEGITDEEIENLRNTYMESEREYFLGLLKIEDIRNFIISCLDMDSNELAKYALKLQNDLEYGQLETQEELKMMELMTPELRDDFHMRKLENAEIKLCILFAAIRDRSMINELIKEYYHRHNNDTTPPEPGVAMLNNYIKYEYEEEKEEQERGLTL